MAYPFNGFQILPYDKLPITPDPVENAYRTVRWGLANVLQYIGEEDPGPKPGALTHVLIVNEDTLYVSPTVYQQLKKELR